MGTRLGFFLNHVSFWIMALVYCWSLYLKFYWPSDGFANEYLADLLCMPIVFYASEITMRFFKGTPSFELSFKMLVVGVLYFSLLFELILPHFSDKYTADWLDVVMYVLGGGAYYVIKRNGRKYSATT